MNGLLLSVWTVFYTVFLAFFLFGVTVFVHEFGHFIVARKCGLVVQTFSIGFGKAIWQKKVNGIVYKIGWIPFGGYVALPQLDPEGMDRIQGEEDKPDIPEISPWKKIAVALAGPAGNLILAVILAVAIWLIPGDDAGQQVRSVIGIVETNSAAYASGLRAGDEVVAVNGTAVNNWYEFSVEALLQSGEFVALTVRSADVEKQLSVPLVDVGGGARMVGGIAPAIPCVFGVVTPGGPAARAGVESGDEVLAYNGVPIRGWERFTDQIQETQPGATVDLTVERDGEEFLLSIVPEYNEEYQRMMIGVQLGGGSGMPWMLYRNPVNQLKFDALAIVRVFKALTNSKEAPQAAKGLGGPIAIFSMLIMAIKMGLVNTLGLIRFLNVNLAILNLLPIPVLDGGHIVFSLWHGITRHKVNAKVQVVLIQICAFLLIGAMLLITFNDVDSKLGVKAFFSNLVRGQTESVQPESTPDAE